jgi:hypothetical protein
MGGPLGVSKEGGWLYSKGKRQNNERNEKMESYEVRSLEKSKNFVGSHEEMLPRSRDQGKRT